MRRTWLGCMFLGASVAALGQEASEPEGLLERIKARMKENLDRLPDYTCQQTIQRLRRANDKLPWDKHDTLRVEVAYVGGQEVHGWTGSKLGEKELRDLAGRGSVGTGSFALHARSVFLRNTPRYTYVGDVELADGRKAIRYDFEVDREGSVYRVRVAPLEAIVAFRGAFWVHPETLDLLKLAIEADDVPGLPVTSVADTMEYSRMMIGGSAFLLPRASELIMVTHEGGENRNLTQIDGCKQYLSESKLNFDADAAETKPPAEVAQEATTIPKRALLDLALETEIDPETAAAGDTVSAVLVKPLKHGERILVPEGAVVRGRLTRVEKEAQPFVHWVLAIEFQTVEWQSGRADVNMTMVDAVGAGVMRVQKTFMPSFDRRKRAPSMSILVREQQRGQGVIHWDARQSRIRKGLKMKWEVQ